MPFASPTEQILARELRSALAGVALGDFIPESPAFREVLHKLEWWIPTLLHEIHPDWNEALDGVYPEVARRIAAYEAEIIGLGLLISDQARTPIYIRLRAAADRDEIVAFECKLGEVGPQGMRRIAWNCRRGRDLTVASRLESIEWVYHFGYGPDID